MKPYEYLGNEDGQFYVCVPEHSDAERLRAANEIARAVEGIDMEDCPRSKQAIEELAETGEACSMSQHPAEPDGDDGCEGGWWCESPKPGRPVLNFYAFEVSDVEEADRQSRSPEEALP